MDERTTIDGALQTMAANTSRWRERAARTLNAREREVFLELADRYDSLIAIIARRSRPELPN